VRSYDMEPSNPNTPITYLMDGVSGDVLRFWGAVPAYGRNTSTGLWCAGSSGTIGSFVSTQVAGVADFVLPSTADYYQSDFSYWYKFSPAPTPDNNPFYPLGWVAGPSVPGNDFKPVGLEHPAGGQFNLLPSGVGVAKFLYNANAYNGKAPGPTLDDVQLTGYRYGPVRSLVASRSAGTSTTVDLSWDAPYRSANNLSIVDTRTINYRIWRKDAPTTFTQLTPVQTNAGHVTATDASAPVDSAVSYVVQAYTPGDDTTWGQIDKLSDTVAEAIPHFDLSSATPSSVGYNGISTVSARLSDYTGLLTGQAASVVLQRSFNGGATWMDVPVAVTEGAAGVYSASTNNVMNTTYRLRFVPTGAASAAALVSAKAYVTTPSTASKVKRNKYFTVSGKVSRVPVANRTAVLRIYQKVGKSWVLRSKINAKVTAGTTIASYGVRTRLTRKGSYRVFASVADGYSTAASTGYRYFTVR
jgi:hypothetical protein